MEKSLKNFVEDNDISGISQTLLAVNSLPINPKEIMKMMFNTVELVDKLNDNDRVWLERPKLDCRPNFYNPQFNKEVQHLA